MSTFSRLRYVVAANVNALIEKAEDPEKLLRALIREMEDASEEARMACAELLAEQQRQARLEARLDEDAVQWQQRAEAAVEKGRDDLAREATRRPGCADGAGYGHAQEQTGGGQDPVESPAGRSPGAPGRARRARHTG
jgi:phage shock protein A